MRYIIFVCVDPAGEKYVPEENNIDEWIAEMDKRKVRILGNRLKGVEEATTASGESKSDPSGLRSQAAPVRRVMRVGAVGVAGF
jgi:hypothetical protein